MKFFNIDLHISVIADLKQIFTKLNHTIEDKCLSNHAFVFNRSPDNVDVINNKNWNSLDKDLCNNFYKRYKHELDSYDGFICTYPPSFSLLYEKFNKPIILQVPIRFEVPFQNDPNRLKWFIDYLKNGIDNKQIIPVCNSLYEKNYCEKYTDREWHLIPNVCEYTGIDYAGGDFFIFNSLFPINHNLPKTIDKNKYLGSHYQWSKLNTIKGIIHVPYNISTMSIFEQYTGNIPLFFPSVKFCSELHDKGLALSQISWTEQNKLISEDWIKLADFHNEEWMPFITYFDSFEDLTQTLKSDINLYEISNKMRSFNITRKQLIYTKWDSILQGICYN